MIKIILFLENMHEKLLGFSYVHENKIFFFLYFRNKDFFLFSFFFRNFRENQVFCTWFVSYSINLWPDIKQNW